MGSSIGGQREAAPAIPLTYSEISPFIHHEHTLLFECSETPFKCDGCKEARTDLFRGSQPNPSSSTLNTEKSNQAQSKYNFWIRPCKEVGIGSRYKCASCDFDLHVPCASPTLTIAHPFYPKCSFQFLSRPPGDVPRYCNACEKDISGFVYHCRACGFDLHPCCAKLPMMLDDGRVQLYLYRKVSTGCNQCGRKGRSWSYRSTCKMYNLHVACVREMLVESWQEIYQGIGKGVGGQPGSPSRIPSLKDTVHNGNGKRKSKMEKYSEVAGLALQFVISAVLGDPTTLIAGVIGSLGLRDIYSK